MWRTVTTSKVPLTQTDKRAVVCVLFLASLAVSMVLGMVAGTPGQK